MRTAKQLEVEAPRAQIAEPLNKLMPTSIKAVTENKSLRFHLKKWSSDLCLTEATAGEMAQGHLSKGKVEFCLTNRASPNTFFTELNWGWFYLSFTTAFKLHHGNRVITSSFAKRYEEIYLKSIASLKISQFSPKRREFLHTSSLACAKAINDLAHK